jgi:hypothetical protein
MKRVLGYTAPRRMEVRVTWMLDCLASTLNLYTCTDGVMQSGLYLRIDSDGGIPQCSILTMLFTIVSWADFTLYVSCRFLHFASAMSSP